MRHLLIVYHTKTGTTGELAGAVLQGALDADVSAVEVRALNAADAGPDDLRWADGLLLGTPENFGYMSGALKDFFDRTFYETEGELAALPYAVFISAGTDGSGALREIRRIAAGYRFREVQPPVIIRGSPTLACLETCRSLGLALAAGLDAGIW